MKTAISIPDPLFEAAEAFARARGLSRSELYATALAAYIKEVQAEQITEQLNRVYATVDSSLDESAMLLQMLSLPKEEW